MASIAARIACLQQVGEGVGAEQHRIVAKVDELMALCDRLEARINTTSTESSRLLESLLHETLAAPSRAIASQCAIVSVLHPVRGSHTSIWRGPSRSGH